MSAAAKVAADGAPSFETDIATALLDVKSKLDAAKKKRDPLFAVDAADLLQRVFAATVWLITGLITLGGTVVLGAEPKATKTWITTELALALATGTKVFGEFNARHGVAAYFYAEDKDQQIRNRLRALLAGRGLTSLPHGRLHLQPRAEFIDLLCDEDLAWIVASCRRLGPLDLLVLDPLRDIHSGEEDKSGDMRNVMRRVRVLGELLGCTVALVHHASKANGDTKTRRPGQRMRGSGAIHGATDSGIYLSEIDGDGRGLFSCVVDSEVKGARSAGRFRLELAIVDDEHGEAIRAAWTFTRDAKDATRKLTPRQAAKAKQDAADDGKIFAFVRELAGRGVHLSRRALREHDELPVGISDTRCREALERLLEVGSLVLIGSIVRVNAGSTKAKTQTSAFDESDQGVTP